MHSITVVAFCVVKGYNLPKGVLYMKPLKQQISITIDEDILEKAKRLAEIDDRSLSQFINIAVKEYVKKLTEKQK